MFSFAYDTEKNELEVKIVLNKSYLATWVSSKQSRPRYFPVYPGLISIMLGLMETNTRPI